MGALGQTRGLDERIAALAERQHGIVAARQLVGLGVSRRAIGVRLDSGRLHSLQRGVYAVGHGVVSQRGRWMAAVLACGQDAVLSHRSAAALWGIRSHSATRIEVTVPRKSRSRHDLRRHFASLPADEVTEVDGVPTTSVPRTVFDLASIMSVHQIEHALRESERLQLYDALSLPHLLERYPRRAGNRAIRECLRRRREAPPGITREALEARFLRFLEQRGLPRPHLNAWLTLGGKRYQVDCLWPDQHAIAELDGYATHGTKPAFHDDRDRDRRLTAAGYRNVRVTWRHLDEIADEVEADLRAILNGSYERS